MEQKVLEGAPVSSIVFYATTKDMMLVAKKILSKEHPDIKVVSGTPGGGGSDLAQKLVKQGAEVIIARGGKAMDIRAAGLPVVVVDLRVSVYELIAAVDKARVFGRRIAAITFPNVLENVDRLSSVRDVEVLVYPLSSRENPTPALRRAMDNGVQVIIGGPITVNAARAAGIPAVLIENDADSILRAATEATRIALARQQERARASMFRVILDYSYEGMISIDADARIFAFNPVAERVLNIRKDHALGREIAKVWPGLKLEKILQNGRDQLAQMLSVNNTDILCNKIAVKVGKNVVAAVATFQDVTDIQRMEESVRRRTYASGYRAKLTFSAIRGESQGIRRVISMAEQFAATNSSVLILGETGVGKELFAQGIHNYSPRSNGPFVPINCAAVPGELLESELFGYVGGAFTGANPKGKPGLFEQAHKGTLFLDEIAEMDLSLQGKLLRALQERTIMRLGSDNVVHVDVRVIAATNRNITDCVDARLFRPDLYYRLNVLRLRIPPLRERREDIDRLAQFFLNEASGRDHPGLTLSTAALKILRQYSWPGNVRELQSFMERIAALHKGDRVISAGHIQALWADEEIDLPDAFSTTDDEANASRIQQILLQNNHMLSESAKQLGISRSTLWRRIKKYGLQQ